MCMCVCVCISHSREFAPRLQKENIFKIVYKSRLILIILKNDTAET